MCLPNITGDNKCPKCRRHLPVYFSMGGAHRNHCYISCNDCRYFYAFPLAVSDAAQAAGWTLPGPRKSRRPSKAKSQLPSHRPSQTQASPKQPKQKCRSCHRRWANSHCNIYSCAGCCRNSHRICHVSTHQPEPRAMIPPPLTPPRRVTPTNDFSFLLPWFPPSPPRAQIPKALVSPRSKQLADIDMMLDEMDRREEAMDRERERESELSSESEIETILQLSRQSYHVEQQRHVHASTAAHPSVSSSSFPGVASSFSVPSSSSGFHQHVHLPRHQPLRELSFDRLMQSPNAHSLITAPSSLAITVPSSLAPPASSLRPQNAVRREIIELDDDGEVLPNVIELDDNGNVIPPLRPVQRNSRLRQVGILRQAGIARRQAQRALPALTIPSAFTTSLASTSSISSLGTGTMSASSSSSSVPFSPFSSMTPSSSSSIDDEEEKDMYPSHSSSRNCSLGSRF
ncbi:hypothetical protein C8J56DRAFT_936811 [Mycena floridula]|nr:hypothetical protein C8J56DRAFT_936811 [Mycena floridula]